MMKSAKEVQDELNKKKLSDWLNHALDKTQKGREEEEGVGAGG